MDKKYIIRISPGKYLFIFRIELLEERKFWGITYFKSIMLRPGKWRDIMDYKKAWAAEHKIPDENIFDLT